MTMGLGVDPEFFLLNKKTGNAAAAHRLIGDSQLTNAKGYLKFHQDTVTAVADRDGAAFEVRNTLVTSCRDYLVPYVAQAMNEVQKLKDKHEKYGADHWVLSSAPVFYLSDLRGPADIRELGCRPDFNAYTMEPQNPNLPDGYRYRMTGGHLHTSMGTSSLSDSLQEQAAFAVLCDALIGLPMVAILGHRFAEGEAFRRTMYGKAGSFRFDPKINKFEYRTLSGRLLLHPTIMTWALGLLKQFSMLRLGIAYGTPDSFVKTVKERLTSAFDIEEIRKVINEHDVDRAEAMFTDLYRNITKDELSSLVATRTTSGWAPFHEFVRVMVEANHNGVFFEDDMQFNWELYSNSPLRDHMYIGVHGALSGNLDEQIFPQRPFLPTHVSKVVPYRRHYSYTHGVDKAKVVKDARGF